MSLSWAKRYSTPRASHSVSTGSTTSTHRSLLMLYPLASTAPPSLHVEGDAEAETPWCGFSTPPWFVPGATPSRGCEVYVFPRKVAAGMGRPSTHLEHRQPGPRRREARRQPGTERHNEQHRAEAQREDKESEGAQHQVARRPDEDEHAAETRSRHVTRNLFSSHTHQTRRCARVCVCGGSIVRCVWRGCMSRCD
jgi:hypothetical protein